MSLVDRVLALLGRRRPADANLAADQARQRNLHGQGLSQTSDESASTRARMEAELDEQRSQRAEPPTA